MILNTPSTRARRGVILLEFFLVVPLFLLMVGAILWLGELTLTQQRAVVAQRGAAWNAGCRYKGDAGAQLAFYARKEPSARAKVTDKEYLHVHWSGVHEAQVRITLEMPKLTKGFLDAPGWQGQELDAFEPSIEVAGRTKNHQVLMRTPQDQREGDGSEIDWWIISSGAWWPPPE